MKRFVLFSVLFLAVFVTALEIVQIFTGYNLSETFNDATSLALSFSMPVILLACIRFLPSQLPSFISTTIYLAIFLIWGYFTYQLTTYSDYKITDVPGDITNGLSWLLSNRMTVILFIAFMGLITIVKWVSADFGNKIGKDIRKNMKRSDDG